MYTCPKCGATYIRSLEKCINCGAMIEITKKSKVSNINNNLSNSSGSVSKLDVISMTKMNKSSASRGVNWGLRIGAPLGLVFFFWIGITEHSFTSRNFLCFSIVYIPIIALGGVVGGAIGGAIAGATKEEAKRDKRIRLLGSLCGALAAFIASWLMAFILYWMAVFPG